MTAFAANFSKVSDTVPRTFTFTVEEVQRNVSYRKALEADIEVYKDDVRQLTDIVASLKRELALIDKTDSANIKAIAAFQKTIAANDILIAKYDAEIKRLEKEIKRWRRKNFWTGIVGALGTAAGLLLWFMK